MDKYLSYLIIFILSIGAGCATTVSHVGCYVADPYINGHYTGGCKDNKAHGRGKAVGIDVYEGDFFEGVLHGDGIYTWSDGDHYNGQFRNGKIHGRGAMIYKNGSIQVGIWENGQLLKSE